MKTRRTGHPSHAMIGVAAAAALALVLSGCARGDGGGGSASSLGGSSVLRMELSADLPTLDPQTVRQVEGNQVLSAVYEGLLEYKPDSSAFIEPALAESYTVSSDGRTYTFALRHGVTFADGTTMDSAGVKASFERFSDPAVGSEMGYMLAGVASYATPDANTFVITLSAPNNSFLTLLASPFGPKVISPTVLGANAGDHALTFLRTHTAGTGAYQVTEVSAGARIVLSRNEHYWGTEPHYSAVTFAIVPDEAAQVQQLQAGKLDIISGVPDATLQTLASDSTTQVVAKPSLQKAQLHLKVTGALADVRLRDALRSAIDRPALAKLVWGSHATESTEMLPVQVLDQGQAADTWSYDNHALASLANGKTLTLGYVASRPEDKVVAGALQSRWQLAGVSISLVPLQSATSGDVASAPDVIYELSSPDSTHPDTWSRLYWYSGTANGNGVLNYLRGGSAAADGLIDKGVTQGSLQAAAGYYAQAGDLIHAQASYITLADVQDTFAARAGLTGFGHWAAAPRTLDLRTIAPTA